MGTIAQLRAFTNVPGCGRSNNMRHSSKGEFDRTSHEHFCLYKSDFNAFEGKMLCFRARLCF